MKQLAILSGKGGTGKTTIAAAFAALAAEAVIVDADVDAADLHLLLHPVIRESGEYRGGSKAWIDPDLCTHCDLARDACRFHAISEDHRVEPLACEGCGLCARLCPAGAITMKPTLSGRWFLSSTRFGPLVHARLGIAAENSGKLVSLLREKAAQLARDAGKELVIVDGSPGIGCPVIASLTGCDLALADHFAIPMVVAINKADLNLELTRRIEEFCAEAHCPMLAHVPFDRDALAAIAAGETLVEHSNGPAAQAVVRLWDRVMERLTRHNNDPNQRRTENHE